MIRPTARFSVMCAMILAMCMSALQASAKNVKEPVEYVVEIVSVQLEGGKGREEFHATRNGMIYNLVGLPKDFKKSYLGKANSIQKRAAAKTTELKAAKTKPSLSSKEAKLAARKLGRLGKQKSKPKIKISNFDLTGATITLTKDSLLSFTEDADAVDTVVAAEIAYGTVTGEASVLVLHITGADKATSATAAQLSDDVFGTDGDPVNLKTHYNTVSYGKKTFVPAVESGKIVDGVLEVTISDTVTGESSSVIYNSAITAAQAILGYHPSSKFDHVMAAIPPGTAGGSWLAYASVGGYYSVYNDNWTRKVSAQMHEVGHNLGLAHSSEGTNDYGDQQGLMGYSYNEDDTPLMGFNAARSSRLTWYSDKEITVSSNWIGQVIGFANYGTATASQNVIVKVQSGTDKYLYVTYNRKTGMNAGTREAGDLVTVVEKDGLGYAQSYLLAKLNTTDNKTFTRTNINGSGNDFVLTFNSTGTSGSVQHANVSMSFGGGGSNNPPVITQGASEAVTMSEDGSPTPFSLTLNATDADGDTITWSISSQATDGTASASGTGASKAIGYTPDAHFNGSDSFKVKVSDGNGGTDEITVNVTVESVNDAPVITQGTSKGVTMSEDGSPTAFSLTLNAADADNDTRTWSISSAASNGSASASGTGNSKSIGYTPNANYNGSDSFKVKVADGNGGSDEITINVTIQSENDAPVAQNDSYQVDEDVVLNVNAANGVLDNDSDIDSTIDAVLVNDVDHGSLTLNSDGSFTYIPGPDFNGSDEFTYYATDGSLNSSTVTVTLTVDPIQDPPVAYDQTVKTSKDKPKAITLTGYDPDGDSLTYQIVADPINGALSGTLPNVTYTPDPGHVGSDSFTFRVWDGAAWSSTATVSITISKTGQFFYIPDDDDGCSMGGESRAPVAWYLPLLLAGAIVAVLRRRMSKNKA